MDKTALKRIIDVAMKREPADLVLKQATIVDVYQAQTMIGDVAIVDGRIAGIGGTYEGNEVHDLTGKVLAPGLIEPHIHVESSYVTPEEFGRLLAPLGTTTVLADPHEIVNVAGLKGLDYMIEAAKLTAIDIRYMLPSCVPATTLENAGAVIEARDMEGPLRNGQVEGLAEFMNYVGVVQADDAVLDKLLVAKKYNKRIDGHSPMLDGYGLNAYIAAGITNDHECSTVEEMAARLSRGMYVFLREGTITQNLRKLLAGVTPQNSRRCVLCGDDVQAKTLLEKGHLDHSIRICVEEGLDAITAIQMATINTAECCGLKDRGAVAPGLRADLIVFDNLDNLQVERTYVKGELVGQGQRYLLPVERGDASAVKSTVHLADLTESDLRLTLTSNRARAIEVVPQEALTREAIVSVIQDSQQAFVYDASQPVTKVAVIERHHHTGNIGLGLLKDYGIQKGAIALSIGHDSHNLLVTGTNDADMVQAVNELKVIDGGVVLVDKGEVLATVPLPIGGIMSELSGEEVSKQLAVLNEVAYTELGISRAIDPIMTLSFMSLSVIPSLKLTDLGLVDVANLEFVPVSLEDEE